MRQLRTKVGNHLLLYYSWWLGDLAQGRVVGSTRCGRKWKRVPDPLNQVTWQVMATGYFLTFRRGQGSASVTWTAGSSWRATRGIHIGDMLLPMQGFIASAGLLMIF